MALNPGYSCHLQWPESAGKKWNEWSDKKWSASSQSARKKTGKSYSTEISNLPRTPHVTGLLSWVPYEMSQCQSPTLQPATRCWAGHTKYELLDKLPLAPNQWWISSYSSHSRKAPALITDHQTWLESTPIPIKPPPSLILPKICWVRAENRWQ